jgi:Uma2 family endonuclease
MVIPSIAERFIEPPSAVISGRSRLVQFTRQETESLVRLGFVPEDASTELLHGIFVHTDRSAAGEDPLTVGDHHTKCVEFLSNLRTSINCDSRHVRSQQPLVCSDIHEPQPDFMVLRGDLRSYTDKPTAADAFCVVEVADSSYERDAGEKLFGYARADIPQYIIINLRNRTAEMYAKPDATNGTYPLPKIVGEGGELSLRVGVEEYFTLPLADILP